MKGLIVDVYRDKHVDCTNGGVTSTYNTFVLVDAKLDEVFDVTPTRPALKVVRRVIGGEEYVHAEPFDRPAGAVGPMAGGNFVYSCDSRFRQHVCAYPIAVHDRFETPELNARLSR